MDNDRRNELKQAYKNRIPKVGVFQITNQANGKIFIGASPDLDKIFNRHRSQLKNGGHPNKELQKDWEQYGADSFSFEIIDQLKIDDDPHKNYQDDLKTLEELWLEKLQPYGERGYHKNNIKAKDWL